MATGLIHGEALAVLKTLDDASVDCVVTDPPYGQTNERYESTVAFQPDVWRECFRVCRKDAALVSFAGSPTYHRIASAIEAAGWKVRQMWAWIYRDGMITSAYPKEGFDRLAPAMTPMAFATKGKALLRLEREGEPWAVRFHQSNRCDEYSERATNRTRRRTSGAGRWPRSVVCTDGVEGLQYFALSHNATNRDGGTPHPNEKPLPLMQWIVGKIPGSVVLDPFMGSGTTGVACLLEGRDFIGIEQEATYVEIARKRIRETQRKAKAVHA